MSNSSESRSSDLHAAGEDVRAASGMVAGGSLAEWLQRQTGRLAREWTEELRARGFGREAAMENVMDDFIVLLTSFLPLLLGPQGKSLQQLWNRSCELFGAVAARRGLAAGEVIEEFQILRELVIRALYEDPPRGGAPSLREVLRLNRIADRGITHASVGHTDTMFFQLLGDPEKSPVRGGEQIALEADAQLALIREEVAAVVGEPVLAQLG